MLQSLFLLLQLRRRRWRLHLLSPILQLLLLEMSASFHIGSVLVVGSGKRHHGAIGCVAGTEWAGRSAAEIGLHDSAKVC
jgi:hypothetical protein